MQAGLATDEYLRIMPKAERVLELGCHDPDIAQIYKTLYPSAHWTSVVNNFQALTSTTASSDQVIYFDFNRDDIHDLASRYDLIVFRGLLEKVWDSARFLAAARHLVTDDGCLVCCISNANHISLMSRWLIGDLTFDTSGNPGDAKGSPPRLFSPSSAIKLFLDAGWLPHLAGSTRLEDHAAPLELLRSAARSLGSSDDAFDRHAMTIEMIFECKPARSRFDAEAIYTKPLSISVVVPVTNHLQFDLNIARSPALAEMDADIVAIENAVSAADGFERGRYRAAGEWIIYCHQDIYLPVSAGYAIASELRSIPEARKREFVIGVIGLAEMDEERCARGGTHFSGTIIDRVVRLDYEATENAESLDESMVIMHRDCVHGIDPEMGWHFWGTDLILSARAWAKARHNLPVCRVINVPIFHNSLTGWTFNEAFHQAIVRMFAKYPDRETITSLCGTWARPENEAKSRISKL